MSTSRILLVPLALCLTCCTARGAEAPRRPAGTGEGAPMATLLIVKGNVTIAPAKGAEFPGEKGLQLLRSDSIKTRAKAVLVLELANRNVVKIDDDLVLAVTDIALLDAPTQTESVDDQLKHLVAVKELDDGDRVIAFQSRKTAGTLGAGDSEDEAATTRKGKAEMKAASARGVLAAPKPAGGAPGGGANAKADDMPAPPPPAPSVQPAAPAASRAKMEEARSESAEPAAKDHAVEVHRKSLEMDVQQPSVAWARIVDGTSVAQSGELPQEIKIDELKACLSAKAHNFVLLRIVNGKVMKVRLAPGLDTPDCAKRLVGKSFPVADGWVRIEVPLR